MKKLKGFFTAESMFGILPTNFVTRMKSNEHPHGVLLATNRMVLVKTINSISVDENSELWINFSICNNEDLTQIVDKKNVENLYQDNHFIFSRSVAQRSVDIKASSIVSVFDLKIEDQ